MLRSDFLRTPVLALLLGLFAIVAVHAYPVVKTRDVRTGLQDPVQMYWGPDDRLWLAERGGRISSIDPETGDQRELHQVRDVLLPEKRGLLGMAVHTNNTGLTRVFLYYHYVHYFDEGGWKIWGKVVRYTYNDAAKQLENPSVIVDSLQTLEWVIGGSLIALPDETLLLSQGNGLENNGNAESLFSTLGKTLRFDFNGAVPADNPWPELERPYNLIWTRGHRDVEGFAVGPMGRVYSTDLGNGYGDEVNQLTGGRDYGWNGIVGHCDNWPGEEDLLCRERNVVNPVYEWYRGREFAVRPSGLVWYTEGVIGTWSNSLLVTTQDDGLYQLQLRDDGHGVVAVYPFLYSTPDRSKHGPLRDICVSPDGRIFVVSRGRMEDEQLADNIFEIISTDFAPETDGIGEVVTNEVATGLDAPGQLACQNDSVVWLTERSGSVVKIDVAGDDVTRVLDLQADVATGSHAGLIGIALHPGFPDSSSSVYLSYTYGTNNMPESMRVVRYSYDAGAARLIDPQVLVEGIPAGDARNGGRLAVEGDALLVTVGDAGDMQNVRNPGSLAGTILRIGLDGSVPEDNPYAGADSPQNLVWSNGWGNPVEALVAPSGLVYTADVGPDATSELNLAVPGGDFGWPLVEGFCLGSGAGERFCVDSGSVDPLRFWEGGGAISGLAYYGSAAIRIWNNSLLATSDDGELLRQIKLSNDGRVIEAESDYLAGAFGKLQDVCVTEKGTAYVVTGNTEPGKEPQDRLIRITSAPDTTIGDESGLRLRTVVEGLDTPWEVLWGPDNWLWLTERRGVISRVNPVSGERRELLDISERVFEFEGSGMLGMVLHPEFTVTPYLYVVYTYNVNPEVPGELTYERLERYRYNVQEGTLTDPLVMIDSIDANIYHDGSRLLIMPDGTLLMSTGDAANRSLPQDHHSINGKMLRINLDGTIPPDNPWADAPWPSSLIWSTGHRNPQGLTIGPDNRIYSSEHGDDADDELNIIYKARNYGYPFVHGFCDDTVNYLFDPNERMFCVDSNVVEPLRVWTPTLGVCGMIYYDHDNIPEWKGSLLMVTLGIKKPVLPVYANTLIQMKLGEDGETIEYAKTYFTQQFGRLRAICTSPDGRVFIASSNEDTRGEPRPGGDRIIEVRGLGDSNVPGNVEDADGVLVVPNPVATDAVVDFGEYFGSGTVEVLDVTGAKVLSEPFGGGERWQLVRNNLPSGLYFVSITDGKKSKQVKVLLR